MYFPDKVAYIAFTMFLPYKKPNYGVTELQESILLYRLYVFITKISTYLLKLVCLGNNGYRHE